MTTITECQQCGKRTPHRSLGVARTDEDGWTVQALECAVCGATNEERQPPRAVILRYDFIGGFFDGQAVEGDEAEAYHTMTHGGEVGKRLWRGGAEQGHKYEVIEVVRDVEQIVVRVKYVGIVK